MRSKPVMLPVMRSLCRVRKRSMTVLRMRCARSVMPETVMERLYFGCGQRPRCELNVWVANPRCEVADGAEPDRGDGRGGGGILLWRNVGPSRHGSDLDRASCARRGRRPGRTIHR